MNLTNLADDPMSTVLGFLEPRDYYKLKRVMVIDDTLFWWNRPVSLDIAVDSDCASLTTWVLDRLPLPELQPRDILGFVSRARSPPVQKAIYLAFSVIWPDKISMILEAFIISGSSKILSWISWQTPNVIVGDVFDTVFLYKKWNILSSLFIHTPRQFVSWCFGNYKYAADPDVIRSMRYVLLLLYYRDRAALISIIRKYHDWLWQYKLDHPSTLGTIVEIHKLQIVEDFDPHRYFCYSAKSPVPEFTEYLLIKGLVVESNMFRMTRDIDQLRLLYNAQVAQKYHNILLMIAVLVFAAIIDIIAHNSVKIEYGRPGINNHGHERDKKVLVNQEIGRRKLGVSLN